MMSSVRPARDPPPRSANPVTIPISFLAVIVLRDAQFLPTPQISEDVWTVIKRVRRALEVRYPNAKDVQEDFTWMT